MKLNLVPLAMARHVSITPWTSLRVVTHRIAHTPTWQLPQVTPYLADIISTSAAVLASPENQGLTKYGSEAALLVHKFKTQVTSILQDKNHQTRWTAVVLIKATVEAGGYEILRGARGWVKGLLETLSVRSSFLVKVTYSSCHSMETFGISNLKILSKPTGETD